MKLNFRDVKVSFMRDVQIRLQSKSMLLSMILMPLTYLLFLAVGLNYVMTAITFEGTELSYLVYIFPGILAIGAMSIARLCGNILHIEKRSGMLETIYATSINRHSFILGRVLATFVLSLIEMIGIVLLVMLLTKGSLHFTLGLLIMMVVALLFGTLSFASFSLILAAVFRSEETYGAMSSLIFTPLTFVSTAFFPEVALPKVLLPLIKVNPLTHMVNTLRFMLVSNTSEALKNLSFLVVIAILLMGIMYRVLSKHDPI